MTESSLEQVVNERISFLKEQLNPSNKPIVNKTFEAQIEAIRNANIEKVEASVLQKKRQLDIVKDVFEADKLFAEIDALEWLQRQVDAHIRR
jgi:hypothetical protein